MNPAENRTVEELLAYEISTLKARLEEISRNGNQRFRCVSAYLENALAQRSARLQAITSNHDIDQRR